MAPRSIRLLETSLLSACVSAGVAAAVHHATEPEPGRASPPMVVQSCGEPAEPSQQAVLTPLLEAAVAADVAFGSRDGELDEAELARVEALYAWYLQEQQALAATTTVGWAEGRAADLRQLQVDLAEMKRLEKAARALEERRAGEG